MVVRPSERRMAKRKRRAEMVMSVMVFQLECAIRTIPRHGCRVQLFVQMERVVVWGIYNKNYPPAADGGQECPPHQSRAGRPWYKLTGRPGVGLLARCRHFR